jgi:hypothetical protein
VLVSVDSTGWTDERNGQKKIRWEQEQVSPWGDLMHFLTISRDTSGSYESNEHHQSSTLLLVCCLSLMSDFVTAGPDFLEFHILEI